MTPEFTKNWIRGKRIMKEVFTQDINTLLTDDRSVKICLHYSVFRHWQTKEEIIAWVGENIGDKHEPFVIEDEDVGS